MKINLDISLWGVVPERKRGTVRGKEKFFDPGSTRTYNFRMLDHYNFIDLFSYEENHDKGENDCGLRKRPPSFDRVH